MKNDTQVPVLTDAHDNVLRRVAVRAGLFFDGTGNNRVNSHIGLQCRALMQAGQAQHTQACAGRHDRAQSSYSNDLSNIARLADLYREQSIARPEAGGWKVFWPVYISGVGTTSAGRDSLWPGQSLGRGSTGVLAKTRDGLGKLLDRLKAFARDNPGCVIDTLELDVFGFSRGAASARHLVNDVLKRDKGDLGQLLAQSELPLSPGFAREHDSVRIRVIGLFDTVAAVGSFRDLGNVWDFNNRRVNLYLPPGCAQQVLHLVARDEQRRNFALNSILPGWSREIVLPGVHSDIGGGYPAHMLEDVLLTRPRVSVMGRNLKFEDSPAWQQAMDDLQALDVDEWFDSLDPQASLHVQCSRVHGRGDSQMVMAAVRLRRQVSGQLARVHLRLMHALACDEGVPFMPLDERPELALDPELQDIAYRLTGLARDDNIGLTEQQEQLLRQRYIHRSAHWSPIIGKTGGLGDAMFVHAPQTGGRIVHPNAGQPGYPA